MWCGSSIQYQVNRWVSINFPSRMYVCLNGVARAKRTRRSCTGTPEANRGRESAVVDGHLYLFGGWIEHNFSQTLRLQRNLDDERSRCAVDLQGDGSVVWPDRGRAIPPVCDGERCVVVDEMIYSYGGKKRDGDHLGIVYRLDPKEIIRAAIEENRPAPPPPGPRTAACVPSHRDWSYLEECVASFLATDSSAGQWRKIGGRTMFMNLNLTSDVKEASIFNLFFYFSN